MPYYHIKVNHVSLNCVMPKSFHLETYRFLRGERQFRSISRCSNRLFSCTRTVEMVSLKVFIFVITFLRTGTGLRRLETSHQFFSKTQKTLQPILTEQESMLRWYVHNALLSKLEFLVSNGYVLCFKLNFFKSMAKFVSWKVRFLIGKLRTS